MQYTTIKCSNAGLCIVTVSDCVKLRSMGPLFWAREAAFGDIRFATRMMLRIKIGKRRGLLAYTDEHGQKRRLTQTEFGN